MSNSKTIICPNCGANMYRQGFGFVCDFCGSSFQSEDYVVIDNISMDSNGISMRYEYLKKNEERIQLSKSVKANYGCNDYRVLSNPPFYANDGRFHRNLKYNLYFDYTNNNIEEFMYMVVHTTEYNGNPYISILLDEEFVITPKFERWEGNLAIFHIEIFEFEEICDSISVSISSNLMNSEIDHYEEFIPYCCRFYNIVFDKCKYTYSIHQLLISDNYGK